MAKLNEAFDIIDELADMICFYQSAERISHIYDAEIVKRNIEKSFEEWEF